MPSRRLIPALPLLLVACGPQQDVAEEPVRAIKTVVVQQRSGEQLRRIAGITEAEIVTDLAFQVAGRVTELRANVGDTVQQGDILAQVDAEPYRLKIQSARGQLDEARARLQDADAKLAQLRPVYEKGYVSRADYDSALANYNGAKSAKDVAASQLALAERDLQHTVMLSPLAGQVSARYVEQFTEVSAGQKIVQISAEGLQKVKTAVPERVVPHLQTGDTVQVMFPTLNEPRGSAKIISGRITEIGSRAGSGSAFPVTVVLDGNDPAIKPGMSAEVTFAFATEATGTAFLLPTTAILPEGDHGRGSVFVYDASAGLVHKRAIQVANIRDNELEIEGELQAGDIVATAGVSFLVDGMQVKLLDPGQLDH